MTNDSNQPPAIMRRAQVEECFAPPESYYINAGNQIKIIQPLQATQETLTELFDFVNLHSLQNAELQEMIANLSDKTPTISKAPPTSTTSNAPPTGTTQMRRGTIEGLHHPGERYYIKAGNQTKIITTHAETQAILTKLSDLVNSHNLQNPVAQEMLTTKEPPTTIREMLPPTTDACFSPYTKDGKPRDIPSQEPELQLRPEQLSDQKPQILPTHAEAEVQDMITKLSDFAHSQHLQNEIGTSNQDQIKEHVTKMIKNCEGKNLTTQHEVLEKGLKELHTFVETKHKLSPTPAWQKVCNVIASCCKLVSAMVAENKDQVKKYAVEMQQHIESFEDKKFTKGLEKAKDKTRSFVEQLKQGMNDQKGMSI